MRDMLAQTAFLFLVFKRVVLAVGMPIVFAEGMAAWAPHLVGLRTADEPELYLSRILDFIAVAGQRAVAAPLPIANPELGLTSAGVGVEHLPLIGSSNTAVVAVAAWCPLVGVPLYDTMSKF